MYFAKEHRSTTPSQTVIKDVMAQTILVVDDKASMRTLLREYLEEQGYRVVTAPDGREALFVAREQHPDLILLDIMMPEMDGLDSSVPIGKKADSPIILLTAKLDEMDKVVGLELGADDYITKPFGMHELVARIRAVLRRIGTKTRTAEVLRAADVTLDRSRRLVQVDQRVANLTPSEFELLAVLMCGRPRLL